MSRLRFCPECNNLLYPKEAKQQKKLLYACRICDFYETAVGEENQCVHRNDVLGERFLWR
jgi:DNA-directed RNA polymerase II subunit RPB9